MTTSLMTPQEVADVFRVDVRTVTAWAREGRLAAIQTPAKQWRFRRDDVERFLENKAAS